MSYRCLADSKAALSLRSLQLLPSANTHTETSKFFIKGLNSFPILFPSVAWTHQQENQTKPCNCQQSQRPCGKSTAEERKVGRDLKDRRFILYTHTSARTHTHPPSSLWHHFVWLHPRPALLQSCQFPCCSVNAPVFSCPRALALAFSFYLKYSSPNSHMAQSFTSLMSLSNVIVSVRPALTSSQCLSARSMQRQI